MLLDNKKELIQVKYDFEHAIEASAAIVKTIAETLGSSISIINKIENNVGCTINITKNISSI